MNTRNQANSMLRSSRWNWMRPRTIKVIRSGSIVLPVIDSNRLSHSYVEFSRKHEILSVKIAPTISSRTAVISALCIERRSYEPLFSYRVTMIPRGYRNDISEIVAKSRFIGSVPNRTTSMLFHIFMETNGALQRPTKDVY